MGKVQIPPITKTQDAEDTPFDDTICQLGAEDVQEALEELCKKSSIEILTHDRNASGTIVKTFEVQSQTHVDSDGLIVVDNNGDVVFQ